MCQKAEAREETSRKRFCGVIRSGCTFHTESPDASQGPGAGPCDAGITLVKFAIRRESRGPDSCTELLQLYRVCAGRLPSPKSIRQMHYKSREFNSNRGYFGGLNAENAGEINANTLYSWATAQQDRGSLKCLSDRRPPKYVFSATSSTTKVPPLCIAKCRLSDCKTVDCQSTDKAVDHQRAACQKPGAPKCLSARPWSTKVPLCKTVDCQSTSSRQGRRPPKCLSARPWSTKVPLNNSPVQ